MKWSVNGIPKGNSAIGLISVSQNYSAIFKAPAQIPAQNPVAVTVQPESSSSFLKRYNVSKLVSNITIYDDAYEVKMIATMKGGSIKEWGGNMTYKDEGSFVVSLDKKEPKVFQIHNMFEVLTYDNCPDRIITNPTSNTGIFHVAGTKQIKITPANPPGQPYRMVEIWFTPYPIELTRFTFNCPPPPGSTKGNSKGKVDLTTSAAGQPPPLLMFLVCLLSELYKVYC